MPQNPLADTGDGTGPWTGSSLTRSEPTEGESSPPIYSSDTERNPNPAFTAAAQGLIEKAGRLLVTEAAARGWLNDAAEAAGVALVRRYQGEVGSFIEQQLAQWSKEEVADRVELAIGRDLQFIRINGTIVGGLAGLIIYAVTMAM